MNDPTDVIVTDLSCPQPRAVHGASAVVRERMRRWWRTTALAVLALALAAAPARGDQPPAAPVRELQAALIQAMQAGPQTSFEQRFERLAPVIERTHHIDLMTRFVLGSEGRELSPGQLDRVTEALERLSTAHYAARFKRYSGEQSEITGSTETARGRIVVYTELQRGDGSTVSLDYVVQRHEGRWGIVNVIADGVSDLALKRAEYVETLRESGFTGLMDHIRDQYEWLRQQ